ncbi:MAG: excinuclease ABC subunit UvrA, partial [Deltaproteobacteria bacterium]|nr:excinuclease ABC subunit UvrA [Deltaproteobacteria bacterium]
MSKNGPSQIIISGARVHNLKNIDVVLPRLRLIAITGLSGSGKSSLAFDTLYAEGQRRYVESLSTYARQFLEQMSKPDVEAIEGLSPAISIEQKSVSHNPRSTVGTVTEIYDYLRLLFARAGNPHCPNCNKPITSQTVQEIVDRVLNLPNGSRFSVLAPVVRGQKGEHRNLLQNLLRLGYSRVNVDGQLRDLEEKIKLDKKKKHNIEVYIDRLVNKKGVRARLTDSVETAIGLAEGLVKITPVDEDDILFSERHACIDCGISLPEVSPRLFSFNSPQGACTECDGLGSIRFIDPERVVPDSELGLSQGAIAPWGEKHSDYQRQMLETLARHYHFGMNTPFGELKQSARQVILFGSGDVELNFKLKREGMSHEFQRPFEGVIPNLERRFRETTSDWMRAEIGNYMATKKCGQCRGRRLRPEALSVLIGNKSIADLTKLSVVKAERFFLKLKLARRQATIAKPILREIQARLNFMVNVGLDYLSLDRSSATLSGGEAQRIRLATQIGSSLAGVLYVLDEPTIGLHARDCSRLLKTLKQLRDYGNTVIVVEHDPATIMASDHVVDMGPGAGRLGGEVVVAGPPKVILADPVALTGAYLSGRKTIMVPQSRRTGRGHIKIYEASGNNLKKIDVEFPLGVFTCVTGVSGSGKSTLVIDTLYRGLAQHLYRSREAPVAVKRFSHLSQVDKVIHIDQSPIGRTPRSNPATYTGVFTPIRELFAKLPESKLRGYGPGRYSFNVKGGRCEACRGGGQIRIEMHFLPDMYVTCEICSGLRFNRETLEIEFRGRNISQVLDMTITEAVEFFGSQPIIQRKLQTLVDVGLGYLQLGQSATTLSGGEAQRVKLARELSKRATGRTLFILDEPTTGLHMDDIRQLIDVLNRLVDQGNTVIVIEHNLDV